MKTLVDTNIQIYRTMTTAWLRNKGDETFREIEPVLSDYVLMEYRKTVIRSIEILCKLVAHVPAGSGNHELMDRLLDILEQMSSGKPFLSPRKVKMILGILAFYLKKHRLFLEGLSPKAFIAHLTYWKEELEDYYFYVFRNGNKNEDVRKKGNYHELTRCHLSRKGSGYDCKKNKFPCDVKSLMNTNTYWSIIKTILNGTIDVYHDIKVDYDKCSLDFGKTNKSVGRSCFSLSDTLHVATCGELKIGVLTGDKELSSLANALGIMTIFYSNEIVLETGT